MLLDTGSFHLLTMRNEVKICFWIFDITKSLSNKLTTTHFI